MGPDLERQKSGFRVADRTMGPRQAVSGAGVGGIQCDRLLQVRDGFLNRLELVLETLRAALNQLSEADAPWVRRWMRRANPFIMSFQKVLKPPHQTGNAGAGCWQEPLSLIRG